MCYLGRVNYIIRPHLRRSQETKWQNLTDAGQNSSQE